MFDNLPSWVPIVVSLTSLIGAVVSPWFIYRSRSKEIDVRLKEMHTTDRARLTQDLMTIAEGLRKELDQCHQDCARYSKELREAAKELTDAREMIRFLQLKLYEMENADHEDTGNSDSTGSSS